MILKRPVVSVPRCAIFVAQIDKQRQRVLLVKSTKQSLNADQNTHSDKGLGVEDIANLSPFHCFQSGGRLSKRHYSALQVAYLG